MSRQRMPTFSRSPAGAAGLFFLQACFLVQKLLINRPASAAGAAEGRLDSTQKKSSRITGRLLNVLFGELR